MRRFLSLAILLGLCFSLTACIPLTARTEPSASRRTDRTTTQDTTIETTIEETSMRTEEIIESSSQTEEIIESSTQLIEDEVYVVERSFGTYSVPVIWEEVDFDDLYGKNFYVPLGNSDEMWTDNVSVRVGENNYAEFEVLDFSHAILRQLAMQTSYQEGITINASGSFTGNDYSVLIYTLEGMLDDTTAVFYYIVGDYRYVEVYLTYKDNPKDAMFVAQTIVNSFVWIDE